MSRGMEESSDKFDKKRKKGEVLDAEERVLFEAEFPR